MTAIEFTQFLLTIAFLYFFTRPFLVFFHELGHAILEIILTRRRVTVYLGSLGDRTNCFHFKIGLLEVWAKRNLFTWNTGIAIPSAKEISANEQIVYVLSGPVASFLVAGICGWLVFAFDGHWILKIIFIWLTLHSFFSLLRNLIPSNKPVLLADGGITYNDGFLIKQLFAFKRKIQADKELWTLYNSKEYPKVAAILSLRCEKEFDENLSRIGMRVYTEIKDYEKALSLYHNLKSFKLIPHDYCLLGIIKARLKLYDEAVEAFQTGLDSDPNNISLLANMGYTYNLLEQYQSAISCFDQAIKLDPGFSYSYANIALSKIKIGMVDIGLKDIEYAIKLDSRNTYAYRTLGIYYMDKGEKSEAIKQFNKAKEIDNNTQGIDELINQTVSP